MTNISLKVSRGASSAISTLSVLMVLSVSANAIADSTSPRPDALLQVDKNRPALVEQAVQRVGAKLALEQQAVLRRKLNALRADYLLAAGLAHSMEDVLDIIVEQEREILLPQAKGAVQPRAKAGTSSELVYTPVTPCRIVDTRSSSGIFSNAEARNFDVIAASFVSQGGSDSNCGMPATAVAVAMNLTATGATGSGNLRAFSSSLATLPLTSNINWAPSTVQQSEANFAIIPICNSGCPNDKELTIYASSSVHLVIDVFGYFAPSSSAGGGGVASANGDGLRVTNVDAISPNMIGGAGANSASTGVRGATIGGGGVIVGGDPDYSGDGPNRVTDHYGFIGGGSFNTAGNDNASVSDAAFATVAGGRGNTAGGQFSFVGGGVDNSATGYLATVAGGERNRALDSWSSVLGGDRNLSSSTASVVGGGIANTANGRASFVGGGENNTAAGPQSAVFGGLGNTASGENSFVFGGTGTTSSGPNAVAGGVKASAPLPGCFVWGDSLNASVACSVQDQFVARARGGVRFITAGTAGAYTGAELPSGAGAWTTLSDVNTKTRLRSVKPADVLNALVKMPVLSWQYKAQPGNVRHIGPTAQDFHKAFGLGESPRGISTVDADGVAFAAIQGLNQKLEAELAKSRSKDAEIATLKSEIAAIKKKLGL